MTMLRVNTMFCLESACSTGLCLASDLLLSKLDENRIKHHIYVVMDCSYPECLRADLLSKRQWVQALLLQLPPLSLP